jgi:PAS domain S-box-containing protein
MLPKTIMNKSSPKRKTPQSVRSTGTIARPSRRLTNQMATTKKTAAKRAARRQESSGGLEPKGSSGKNRAAAAEQATAHLLHELRVHQIELEMQNEELRRMHREVEAAEQEYKSLYDTVPVGCFTLDAKGTVLEANPAGVRLLGASATSLIGRRFLLFISEKDRLDFWAFCKALLKEKALRACELCILNGGERPRTVQVLGTSVKRPGRGDSALRVAVTDITERKRAEEAIRGLHDELEHRVAERTVELDRSNEQLVVEIAERNIAELSLHESEDRLRGMMDHSPNLIFMKDLQGHYVDANKQFELTFHLTRQDIVGKTDHDIFPPEHAAAYRANDLEVLKAGRSLQFEEVALHDDGLHTNIVGKFPLRRIDGSLYAICGIVTDITELKQAEASLRDREHEFRLLADNVPAYFSYVDTELRYRFVNKRYEELFDRPSLELTGQLIKDVVGEVNFRTIEPYLQEALAGREGFFSYPKVLPNGDSPWMNVHYTPDRDETGRIRGVLALMTDVTIQKRYELALKQNQLVLQEKRNELQMLTDKLLTAQDTERQRIARDLHDDFSQRLVAVALDLEDLRRNPPLMPQSFGKALEPIREELAQLSDDLRNLAHQLHPSLLKHAGLRAALEEHVHHAVKRTGLDITLKIRDVPDSLDADVATCLFRVFQECLQNVAKHANATEVLVKLSGSSKGIGLSVTDNGTGFDHHDKSSHQKGLGLTSMRERVRSLNGFLNIHSRPAAGTKVCAWIPSQEKKTP